MCAAATVAFSLALQPPASAPLHDSMGDMEANATGWQSDCFGNWPFQNTFSSTSSATMSASSSSASKPSTPRMAKENSPLFSPRYSLRAQQLPSIRERRLAPTGTSSDEEADSPLDVNASSSGDAVHVGDRRPSCLSIARIPKRRSVRWSASPDVYGDQSSENGSEAEPKERASTDGATSDDDPNKKKRSRTLTTPTQQARLLQVLQQTRFPSTELREELAAELGMTPRRVQIWFQNRRQGMKKAMDERAEAERAAAARSEMAVFLHDDSRGYSFGAYPTPYAIQGQSPTPGAGAFLPPHHRMFPQVPPIGIPGAVSPTPSGGMYLPSPGLEYQAGMANYDISPTQPFTGGVDARSMSFAHPQTSLPHSWHPSLHAPGSGGLELPVGLQQRRHTAPEPCAWPSATPLTSDALPPQPPMSAVVPPNSGTFTFEISPPPSSAASTTMTMAPITAPAPTTGVDPDINYVEALESLLSGNANIPPELLAFAAGSGDGAVPAHNLPVDQQCTSQVRPQDGLTPSPNWTNTTSNGLMN